MTFNGRSFSTNRNARASRRCIGVTQYLVLLKLSPTKVTDTINDLRKLPQKPSPGVDLQYVMNVFGTWDVAMWFDTENSNQALEFIREKLGQVPGVVDVYTVPTFPNRKPNQE
jgi:DNA-binding Lrp family transcriptional regulator